MNLRAVRSYVLRAGRMTDAQQRALVELCREFATKEISRRAPEAWERAEARGRDEETDGMQSDA